MVDRAMHRHAARQAQLDHDASLALWHSDRETWLAQHPDFDPTDPTHADPSGRPLFNAITARDVTLESEVSREPLRLWPDRSRRNRRPPRRLHQALRSRHDRSIPRFSDHNPLHHDWVSVIMFALLAFSLYYFARKPSEDRGLILR